MKNMPNGELQHIITDGQMCTYMVAECKEYMELDEGEEENTADGDFSHILFYSSNHFRGRLMCYLFQASGRWCVQCSNCLSRQPLLWLRY